MRDVWLFVEPEDVLFFRDSKPFAAGEASFAQSLEVLNPGTFHGMIRSRLLELGLSPQASKNVRLTFLAWAKRFTDRQGQASYVPYFPSPHNLMYVKDVTQERRWRFTGYVGLPQVLPIKTDAGADMWGWLWLRPEDTALKAEELTCWLHPIVLQDYLAGKEKPFLTKLDSEWPLLQSYCETAQSRTDKFLPSSALYAWEARTGLALDAATRTALEGNLYTITMLRPQSEVGFLMHVESNVDLPPGIAGPALLGGWRKGVWLHQVNKINKDFINLLSLPEARKQVPFIVIYFYTMNLCSQGHLPVWIDSSSREVVWPNSSRNLPACRLAAAYSSKPIAISGWDAARNVPKPVQRAVPPGAVWFLAKKDGQQFTPPEVQDILTTLNNQTSLSDQDTLPYEDASPPNYMGYGLFFAGVAGTTV